jgi:uncharacterized protein
VRRPFEQLGSAKTVLLTTYRRDGTPVATPVSIAFDGDRAFFRSWHKAHKTTRLRDNPAVEVAPSTFSGKPTAPAVGADARLLEGPGARVAARALARRHRLLQAAIVPIVHRLMRYRTLHYELSPHEHAGDAGRRAGRSRVGLQSSEGNLRGVRWGGVGSPHHAEPVQQPQQAGEDRDQQRHL